MKITIWDILSIVLILASVVVLVVVIQIFSDPTSGLNPFPRPTLPAVVVLPTATKTPLMLPPTWTPTAKPAVTDEGPAVVTLKPTWTLQPTATSFVVPTWTLTPTPSFTPTISRTPTETKQATNTPPLFAVTSVKMNVDANVFSGACPPGHVFTFVATIYTSTGGTVKYHWEFSNGNKGEVKSLVFGGAESQAVVQTWEIKDKPTSNPFEGWARIYIDEPNHQAFSNQKFVLTCAP